MTIFKDINELKMCVLEMEEYFPDDYISVLGYIEKIKELDLDDKTKQNLCNGELRKGSSSISNDTNSIRSQIIDHL